MTPIEEIRQKLDEFESLKEQGNLTADAALALASRAAELVIEHHRKGGDCLREAVNLICQIATDADGGVARSGITGLFPLLVERLNDSFDPAACRLYDQLFAQVIEFCRRLPGAKLLDEGLKQFGLISESDLLARKAKLRYGERKRPELPATDNLRNDRLLTLPVPKKVLLLSRVTIGADVAINSAIIAKLRQAMPLSEFVIFGSRKLRELYGGDDRIRIREIGYERGGSLIARLTSWLDVVAAINEERRGFGKEEVWVIDPDSRLTQLGLLPLVENDDNYFFFESRGWSPVFKRQPSAENQPPKGGTPCSIAELAYSWSGELIGNHEPTYPFVALPAEHRSFGQLVAKSIRNPQSAIRNLVAVSFGIGGNQSKRVSAEFEQQLIEHLLTHSKIILDKGASIEERNQINSIVARLCAQGHVVIELAEANKAEIADRDLQQAVVVTWDGGIGAFAGLIAACDKYIGYDSAGQHIAAALGVTTLTVFVNSNNATFAERWRPYGKGVVKVLNVQPGQVSFQLEELKFAV